MQAIGTRGVGQDRARSRRRPRSCDRAGHGVFYPPVTRRRTIGYLPRRFLNTPAMYWNCQGVPRRVANPSRFSSTAIRRRVKPAARRLRMRSGFWCSAGSASRWTSSAASRYAKGTVPAVPLLRRLNLLDAKPKDAPPRADRAARCGLYDVRAGAAGKASAKRILMNACRVTPIRCASRAMAASSSRGKSTFTRCTVRPGRRAEAEIEVRGEIPPASCRASNASLVTGVAVLVTGAPGGQR